MSGGSDDDSNTGNSGRGSNNTDFYDRDPPTGTWDYKKNFTHAALFRKEFQLDRHALDTSDAKVTPRGEEPIQFLWNVCMRSHPKVKAHHDDIAIQLRTSDKKLEDFKQGLGVSTQACLAADGVVDEAAKKLEEARKDRSIKEAAMNKGKADLASERRQEFDSVAPSHSSLQDRNP